MDQICLGASLWMDDDNNNNLCRNQTKAPMDEQPVTPQHWGCTTTIRSIMCHTIVSAFIDNVGLRGIVPFFLEEFRKCK